MTGLILEGGGMRGAFTAGVLDAFLNNDIRFDSVYGVSAGASNGASYISKQYGRNRKVFVDGIVNYRYFSLRHLPLQRNLLDVKLLFDTYPNRLIPFDYETFEKSSAKFYTVLTDCISGSPVYIERGEVNRRDFMMKVLTASNSLPLLSPAVRINGRPCLDGGLSDSIPLARAQQDGCKKSVVILTREAGYRKSHSNLLPVIKALYRKYPGVIRCFEHRHEYYNDALEHCSKAEAEGTAIILCPESTMDVGRTETDATKLERLYLHGLELGRNQSARLKDFLGLTIN